MQQRDFISSQLNDTRYIAKLALAYVKQLGCDVTTSKGSTTAWLRHQWGLNNLIGETDKKERTDHRHHAIDAAVVACVDRGLYKQILTWTKNNEQELKIEQPYPGFRDELDENLKHLIVSHDSQRKLSGGLHEETGAGYIEKHGGLVYRKNLTPDFTEKNAKSIVDITIKELVLAHLDRYDNDPKKAFSDNITVYHKNHKTPIKRVRVLQSSTTRKKLEQGKFGVKDKSGIVFNWMSYGNMHHIEILRHKETCKYKGEFVTMMQASHRAKGIKSMLNTEGIKQPIIKQDHGDDWQFIMALHINDLVSVNNGDGKRVFYRVQKLGGGYDLTLRLHTESQAKRDKSLLDSKKMLENSLSNFISELDIRAHKINVIGIITND